MRLLRIAVLLCLPLVLALGLTACGDDSGPNPFKDGGNSPFGNKLPFGIDPDDPDIGRKIVEGMTKKAADIELNDENLGKLYELGKRLKSAEGNPVKAMALSREFGWNFAAYGLTMARFEQLRQVMRTGPEQAQRNADRAQKRLADFEKQVAAATGETKAGLQAALSVMKMTTGSATRVLEEAKKLENPAYRKMIESWGEKFDALKK